MASLMSVLVVGAGIGLTVAPSPVAASCTIEYYFAGSSLSEANSWGGKGSISAQNPAVDSSCAGSHSAEWIMSNLGQSEYAQVGWMKQWYMGAPQMWAEFGGPGFSGGFLDVYSGWALNGTESVNLYSTGSGGDWNAGAPDGTGSVSWQEPVSKVGMYDGNVFEAEGESDENLDYIGGFSITNPVQFTSIQYYPTESSSGSNPYLSPQGSSNTYYEYCAAPISGLSENENFENFTVNAGAGGGASRCVSTLRLEY